MTGRHWGMPPWQDTDVGCMIQDMVAAGNRVELRSPVHPTNLIWEAVLTRVSPDGRLGDSYVYFGRTSHEAVWRMGWDRGFGYAKLTRAEE